MTKPYLLVDLENRQPEPERVAARIGESDEAWIFFGEQQMNLLPKPEKVAKGMARLTTMDVVGMIEGKFAYMSNPDKTRRVPASPTLQRQATFIPATPPA